MPLSEAQAAELTRRFQVSLKRIAARASALTAAEWDALGSWDERDIPRYVERVTPTALAAKQAAINASAGYYSFLTDTTPDTVPAARVPSTLDTRAPFTAYWHDLSQGHPWDEAFAYGRSRAESTASDLVVGTSRQVAGEVAARSGLRIVGWRRVLTGASCRWCAAVARQRYKSAESAHFGHDHCDCTVAPIWAEADPGQVINAERVETVAQTLPVRV